MIRSIKLTGHWAKRVGAIRSRTLKFYPGVNVLVGPNGSGKSSVLRAIAGAVEKPDRFAHLVLDGDRRNVKAFDFEFDNPRLKPAQGPFARFRLWAKFAAHGEVNRTIIRDLESGGVLLLDEPDQSLDIEGVVELVKELTAGYFEQAIISAHHPLILLQCSEFRCIELRSGYLDRVRACFEYP